MVRNMTFILVISIIFSYCDNNFGIKETKENLQNTSVSKADSLIIDSLMNYCYHLAYGIKGNLPVLGTAFFLRYNSKVYLLSALHNFTGIDPETGILIKGLSNSPKDLWIWQSFYDRADWFKNYKLYYNKDTLFTRVHKNTNKDSYDLGASNINDSIQMPNYILDFDKKSNAEYINIGDTLFYCTYPLKGNQQSETPRMFIGKIKATPTRDNLYITSDVFSRPGSSGAAVFKLSNHKASLIGVIARGNSDENIVYITPFKEAFTLLKL